MIPFNNRFHGHSSLRYVYKNGQAIRSHSITIKSIANPHRKQSRVAVVISKKVLKSAVRRNLIRRRIYEIIRQKLPYLNGVYDIAIIILSSELLAVVHDDLSEQIDQLFDQSGMKK
jgi:ribonuclease P protein component